MWMNLTDAGGKINLHLNLYPVCMGLKVILGVKLKQGNFWSILVSCWECAAADASGGKCYLNFYAISYLTLEAFRDIF
ncbi:hypothetical protein P8452_45539 [Trifolium repens]|nr:hypothetical protein P8452_45539 [Trifolium repens]